MVSTVLRYLLELLSVFGLESIYTFLQIILTRTGGVFGLYVSEGKVIHDIWSF